MSTRKYTPILGIYEKALPIDLSWPERFKAAKALGFDYLEISIDETPERQQRLQWDQTQKMAFIQAKLDNEIDVPSMCLSVHRAYPFGSKDPEIRKKARTFMLDALRFAQDLGIRNIQLAGYDVYYEPSDATTKALFLEGISWAIEQAAGRQIMLSVEIMDTAFMSSISRWLDLEQNTAANPWFSVYPDVGNLSAWENNVTAELQKGIHKIAAIHLKDTYAITPNKLGQFRDVPFGDGCVDFPHVFKTLSDLNYQGAFLIEMWTKNDGHDLARITESKDWLIAQMKGTRYAD